MPDAGPERPTYSVCICNYNMDDTLEQALTSVLDQLDDRYEVLVVDDGSNDNSLDLIKTLADRYSILRYLPLKRDKTRKLGETRNISVREARGEYCLLHVDADDIWEPHLDDFIKVFHSIEDCKGPDFLLAGQQVSMAHRGFLLEHGPYRNLSRVQDRDLLRRLAATDSFIFLDHRVFRKRLSRPRGKLLPKIIRDTWGRLIYDLQVFDKPLKYIIDSFVSVVHNRIAHYSFLHRAARAVMVVPAFFVSRQRGRLPVPDIMRRPEALAEYIEHNRGTFAEVMARHGCATDLSFLDSDARSIFSERPQV